jgi:hypothetical protein
LSFILFYFLSFVSTIPPGSVQVGQEDCSTITFIAHCEKQMDEAQKMKDSIHLLRFKVRHSHFNKDFFITEGRDVKRQPALLSQGKG